MGSIGVFITITSRILFDHHVLTRDRSDVAPWILDLDFGDVGGGPRGDVELWFSSSSPEAGG